MVVLVPSRLESACLGTAVSLGKASVFPKTQEWVKTVLALSIFSCEYQSYLINSFTSEKLSQVTAAFPMVVELNYL